MKTIQSTMLICLLASVGTLSAPHPVHAAPPIAGKVDCAWGASDCNVCADDVEGQFRDAFSAPGLSWSTKRWSFNWDSSYPPYAIDPDDDFASGSLHHIQSFIRTNHSSIRFAGAHDDDDGQAGNVFFVHQDSDGVKTLHALHRTTSRHPSGMQAIGRYVAAADGNRLRLYDLTNANDPQPASMTRVMPDGFAAGGGLGVVRLVDGSHLVLAYGPGGSDPDSGTRRLRLYNIIGGLVSGDVHYLGSDAYTQSHVEWTGWYEYSENLSAITECGTGRIYIVTSEGDSTFNGDGYWLLSRVLRDSNGVLQMIPRSAKRMAQDDEECWLRGSGTVHVDANHVMDFYCHQRKNVKYWWEEEDLFSFRVGEGF